MGNDGEEDGEVSVPDDKEALEVSEQEDNSSNDEEVCACSPAQAS